MIMDYAKDLKEQMEQARSERVFITHSGCSPEVVEKVRSYLEEHAHFDEILITRGRWCDFQSLWTWYTGSFVY